MLTSELVSIVRNQLGDGGGVYAKETFVLQWLNEAVRDIFRKTNIGRDNQFTFSLLAGENQFTSVEEIYKVHYISSEEAKLEEMIYENILDQYGYEYATTPGTPRYFWKGYESGVTVLNFAPVAESDITLTASMTFFPADLTISDDTTEVLPSSFTDDLIRFCIMRGHERQKDFRASEKAEEQYNNNISERVWEGNQIDDDFQSISADPFDFI